MSKFYDFPKMISIYFADPGDAPANEVLDLLKMNGD